MITPLLLAASLSCALPPGWRALDAERARYVVFGEVHGTFQSPLAVGVIACALAKRGERLLVAVELGSDDNAGLQRAWSGGHAGFRARMRAAMPGWRGRQDGVGSVAMADLLDDLHGLKAAGRRIGVVAFNATRRQAEPFAALGPRGDHEAAQARNIFAAASARAYDRVIVLVGNYHARKAPIERDGGRYQPMAMRLAPAAQVRSIFMAGGAGAIWNCLLRPGGRVEPSKPIPPSAIDCAAHPTRGMAPLAGPQRAGPRTSDTPWLPPGYDGWLWLGPSTAAEPAVPAE